MYARVLFLCLLLLAALGAQAQTAQQVPEAEEHIRYLVLDKPWPVHRIRFYPGQVLTFKLKDEPGWRRGRIQTVYKNAVVVMDAVIPFSDIKKIRVARGGYLGNFLTLSAGTLLGNGVVLVALGGLNSIENKNGEGANLSIAGAGAMVVGGGLLLLNRRTFKISGNRRLRSI